MDLSVSYNGVANASSNALTAQLNVTGAHTFVGVSEDLAAAVTTHVTTHVTPHVTPTWLTDLPDDVLRILVDYLKNDPKAVASLRSTGTELRTAIPSLDEAKSRAFARGEVVRGFEQNKEVIMALVEGHPMKLDRVQEPLKSDVDVVTTAVKSDPMALMFAREGYQNNKEIVLLAVTCNGFALQHASEDLQGDRDVVLAAVSQNPSSIRFASAELKGNWDIALIAVRSDSTQLGAVSLELQEDAEFLRATGISVII